MEFHGRQPDNDSALEKPYNIITRYREMMFDAHSWRVGEEAAHSKMSLRLNLIQTESRKLSRFSNSNLDLLIILKKVSSTVINNWVSDFSHGILHRRRRSSYVQYSKYVSTEGGSLFSDSLHAYSTGISRASEKAMPTAVK